MPDGQVIEDPFDIANSFGKCFASNSSDKNLADGFMKHKEETERSHLNLEVEEDEIDDSIQLNAPITFRELKVNICQLKGHQRRPRRNT